MSFKIFAKRLNHEKVMKEASNLTFVTVLGFVPFLLFILFLLPEISFLNIQDVLKKYIISTFLPESADMIINQVNELMNNTIQMNIFNVIMVVITSYSLFASISSTFDKILKIESNEQKNIINTLQKFFGTIIFGFLTIVLLFSMSSLPYFSLIFEHYFVKLL
ncbi:MAG TPA: YhjD/YihY/BrkB family envelope integrity protein, partial [Candidatus Cloacimonadota bacterium]|nr:YhjD/YihY/BrkB family envelope integrity protein [Candidatus Cloacimonadota bacterium]